MATKKTKAASPKISAPTTDQDGCVILQGELFWKWKAVDSEARYVASAIKLKQSELDVLLDQHPDVKAALGERTSLVQRSVVAQNEMRHVLAEMEKYLGIPMKDVSIDDQTGKVFLHGPDGTEPLTAAKPKARSKKNK